ncbi:MAG: NADH-quinone oxidoreductase subunit L [Catenulispora sp.]|nr:NADH-quinone oxidoreductase subunit L [Catenulispora sp.]
MSAAEVALWSLVLLPAVAGGVLALAFRAERVAVPVALATAGLDVVASVVVALERPRVSVSFVQGADFTLAVDGLSALVVLTLTVVTLLVLVFSAGDIAESRPRFYGLMLLFAAAAALTAVAATLPALLIAWEVMGATSYALIGFRWREGHRVSAGLTAFVTTRTADVGLYVAAGAALAGGAGFGLANLPQASAGWRNAIALGILVAALGKAAQLPFSFWLSRAMEGPSPVSALLHSAAMVAMGSYLLLRVEPLLAATSWAGSVAAWFGVSTALLLGAVAVAQTDLKQLLAASTGAQLGFVVMAAGLGSVSGGTAHLVAHAATKALLFLVAGAWLSALGTKSLAGLAGIARRWRLVGVTATIGALSLAGVAPLSLWATKDEILAAARHDSVSLYAAGLTASALSAAYAAKMLVVIWRARTPEADRYLDEEESGTRRITALEKAPLVILAIGAAVLGLLALPPLARVVTRMVGTSPEATVVELLTSAVIAVVVVLLVSRRSLPEPRWARNWLALERAAELVAVRPTFWLAHLLGRFDEVILDRAVEQLAGSVQRLACGLARFELRAVDGAVEGIAGAVRRLGRVARSPQTGQLHQYYFQAVAVLAVGVVVLLAVR